jgi:hypothetical protein
VRDPRRRGGPGIRHLIARREFLLAALAGALAPRAFARAAAAAPELEAALERSGFVYVSPLRADGSESTCHGEVWFGWEGGAVVLITARDSWKARAVARGLDGARIWVGDHGTWKRLVGSSEEFRKAPVFDARAEIATDAALLERLIASYERKYPAEIGRWRDRFREGFADGSRVLIRYTPLAPRT